MPKPMKYTAVIVETEEILECTNFKVLYKAALRHARYYTGYEGAPHITVHFYINLPSFIFGAATPYYTMTI